MDEEYGNEKEALKWLKVLVNMKFDDKLSQLVFHLIFLDGIDCKCCEQNDKQA